MKNQENPIVVDVRGSLCPKPVIETKRVADAHPECPIETIVDNEISRDNVEKFGKSRGAKTQVIQDGKDYHVIMVPGQGGGAVDMASHMETDQSGADWGHKVILMTKDYLGEGSEELGRNLMKTFWVCMLEADVKPKKIYFINSSVKMVAQDSPHLENLKALEAQGVEIAACGICLDYYGLKESLGLGSITNMYAITDAILGENLIKL